MRIDYSIDHPVRLEVNFEVEGFTILLGQSGEGKTTLLRAIAGLLPARGEPLAACCRSSAPSVIYHKAMLCFRILAPGRTWHLRCRTVRSDARRRSNSWRACGWWMWPIVI